jgi:hypothetical protein
MKDTIRKTQTRHGTRPRKATDMPGGYSTAKMHTEKEQDGK